MPNTNTKLSIQLSSPYNITNTLHLATDLRSLNIKEDTLMCSFDISNMYSNIPTKIIFIII
jgi:hypothetical protein